MTESHSDAVKEFKAGGISYFQPLSYAQGVATESQQGDVKD